MWAPPSFGPLSGRMPLYKVPFPLGPASSAHMPPALPQILSWRRVLPVGWWRPSVAGITLVSYLCQSCRGHAAFGKASVGGFRHLCKLGPLMMKMSAGCWRSRPSGRSRPLWPNVAVIPGTSAGRWICPWPTRMVIPTTLAPKTGEVSWVSMGLRRVLFLAEVNLHPSKSQDLFVRLGGRLT
jgi:hypothetical protein